MSLLAKYTTPAERLRGCRFADRFESQALVERNGGSVIGAPTFDPVGGVTLDGSNDCLQFDFLGHELNSDPLTILITFYPDFDYDEDAERWLFSDNGNDYSMRKQNNAGSNVLSLRLGGTDIGDIAAATYGPYWNQGGRNQILISSTSGDTDVYLNNHLVMDSDATAWTPVAETVFNLGASSAPDDEFDGRISEIQIFHAKLTADEAEDYYDNTTFAYVDHAIVFPMTNGAHNGGNPQDALGLYTMTGNGAPRKLDGRGYEFDGAADYFNRSDDGTFLPSGKFSVQCVFAPSDVTDYASIFSKWLEATNKRSWMVYQNQTHVKLYVSEDGTANDGVQKNNCLYNNMPAFVTATYDPTGGSGSSVGKVYVNDLLVAEHTTLVGPVSDQDADVIIGAYNGGTHGKYDGIIYYVAYFPGIILTPLQHLDFMARMRASLQRT